MWQKQGQEAAEGQWNPNEDTNLISTSGKNDSPPDERQQLNKRQLTCLRIIDEIDRQNEKQMTQEWDEAERGQSPPESMWRWIQYDPSHTVSDPELKRRLREAGIGGGGIKTTMKSLWMRDLIHIRNEQLGRYRVLSVQLTDYGRKLARQIRQSQ